MNRKLVIVFAVIYLAFNPIQSFAELTPQAISVELSDASTCFAPQLALAVYGDSFASEKVSVTDQDNANLLEQSFAPQSGTFTGVLSRSLSIPAAASKNSGLIAIKYEIASLNQTLDSANFFVVMDCATKKTIYACTGGLNDCPQSMATFLPSASINETSLNFGKVVADGPGDYSRDLYLNNAGILGLQVKSFEVTGPDAGKFFNFYDKC